MRQAQVHFPHTWPDENIRDSRLTRPWHGYQIISALFWKPAQVAAPPCRCGRASRGSFGKSGCIQLVWAHLIGIAHISVWVKYLDGESNENCRDRNEIVRDLSGPNEKSGHRFSNAKRHDFSWPFTASTLRGRARRDAVLGKQPEIVLVLECAELLVGELAKFCADVLEKNLFALSSARHAVLGIAAVNYALSPT